MDGESSSRRVDEELVERASPPRSASIRTSLLHVLASCEGSPTDHGNVWGGVSIGVVNASGVAASGMTDDQGRSSASRIRPGEYRIRLQLGRTGPGYFVGDVVLHQRANRLDIVSR